MILKLLKVEFRDALSSMLPIGVGMVALSALVALTSVLTGRLGFHSGHWDWLNALLSFATGVCFIAVLGEQTADCDGEICVQIDDRDAQHDKQRKQ